MTATSDAHREEAGVDGPTVELKFVDQNGKQFWTDADGRISYDDPEAASVGEREALAALLTEPHECDGYKDRLDGECAGVLADAILKAGWRSPAQMVAALAEQREGIAAAIVDTPWEQASTRGPLAGDDAETWIRGANDGVDFAATIARTFTKGARK